MTPEIIYLFDPLCGWCYGAGPGVARLVAEPGIAVTLQPVGLFAGSGARPMDPGFASYIVKADERIAAMTGQPFSDAYRQNVLFGGSQKIDSGPATLALTAVHLTTPNEVAAALKAIQAARYVGGQDVTSLSVLENILRTAGLETAAERLKIADAALETAMQNWTSEGMGLMQAMRAQGVPALQLQTPSGGRYTIDTQALFGPQVESLIEAVRKAA
ncbi:DsbA family protein [Pannonibacter phragmitetus]|uniref:DsbA family protein n=1 Tax=Pannonibacter phragmitetus TaxID=121719 RepID=UPI003D2F4EFF